MHVGDWVALAITLLVTAVVTVGSIAATVLSLVIPLAILGVVAFVMIRSINRGQFTIVSPGIALQGVQGLSLPVPKANRLKKVVCRTCGGSKVLPPKTAYVYCDYCGTLVDWDFQIACTGAMSAKPGPAYEALQAREKPVQDAALARGDREAYAASVARVFDGHFSAAPRSWSPRLGDPRYRARLLECTAQHYTAAAFDPDCKAKEAAMNDAVRKLQWIPGFQPKCTRASFEPLLEAVLAHNARFTEVGEPTLANHPDEPTPALQRAISRSAFAQGWMPYLHKPDQDFMIARLDLAGEYVEVPTIETTERRCGGCAKTLRVAPGAKKVVCEDCGHTLDVSRPEISCSGCGGPITVLWHEHGFKCPHCAMELRVD